MILTCITPVLCFEPLNLFKQRLADDSRTAALHSDDIFISLVGVIIAFTVGFCSSSVKHKVTCIFFIIQNLIQAVFSENTSSFGSVAVFIQIVNDSTIAVSFCEHFKDDSDRLSLMLIDDKLPVLTDIIAQRRTIACVLTLQGSLLHSFHDLTSQISAIVFSHSFKDAFHHDALRAVIYPLQYTAKLDIVFLQALFVDSAVVAVTAESVQLMHQNDIEHTLAAVCYHLLELWAVVCSS